jgi:hypothetical protein
MKVGLGAVRAKRLGLGIPACAPQVRWPPEMIARLGTVPDGTIAEAMNVSRPLVQRKRAELGIPAFPCSKGEWTPRRRALIGVLGDRSLAELVGTTVAAVAELRRKLGRPPARAAMWAQRILSDIGTMSDQAVATKHHNRVSHSQVRPSGSAWGFRATARPAGLVSDLPSSNRSPTRFTVSLRVEAAILYGSKSSRLHTRRSPPMSTLLTATGEAE